LEIRFETIELSNLSPLIKRKYLVGTVVSSVFFVFVFVFVLFIYFIYSQKEFTQFLYKESRPKRKLHLKHLKKF
jgi:hypothetical protein